MDGDAWLDVQIQAPDLSTPDPDDTKLVDEMFDVQAEIFSGAMNAGDLQIVRTIRTPDPGTAVDTATFRENRADYSVDIAEDGTVIVANTGGTQIDGSNRLRNIERLEFADQTVDVADLVANNPATGEVALDSTTPVEDVDITASVGTVADVDGLPTDPTAFTFTWESETTPDVWEPVGTTPPPSTRASRRSGCGCGRRCPSWTAPASPSRSPRHPRRRSQPRPPRWLRAPRPTWPPPPVTPASPSPGTHRPRPARPRSPATR